MGNPINVNVNQSGFQALQRMDTNRNGSLNLQEVKKAADSDGDGKVGLREAAALEEQLGRYMDKNLASKIAESSMGFEPLEVNFNTAQANRPAAPTAPNAPAPAPAAAAPATPAERIPGTPGNVRTDDGMRINNSPADPPMVLRSKTPGQPVNLELADGVTLSKWPPAPATFKDPETGRDVQGFKVELSTGDVMLIPQGQALSIRDPQDAPPAGGARIGGSEKTYDLSAEGQATDNEIRLRYATVFCTREL